MNTKLPKTIYGRAKQAYDKYMTDNAYADLVNVSIETRFDLPKGGATHTIDGISTFILPDAQARLNTSNVHQYDSNKLEASDIVATSPNNDTEWAIQVKEGDKFVVTYDNFESV